MTESLTVFFLIKSNLVLTVKACLTVSFHLQFLCENDLCISCCLKEVIEKFTEINTFQVRNTTVFNILDLIKVSRVSL